MRVPIAIALVLAAGSAFAQDPSPAEARYRSAVDAYEHGDYALAEEGFRAVLYPPEVDDPEKIKRAHLYRGISLFLLDRPVDADREFYEVLKMDPEFRPEALFTPPPVLAAFDRIRAEKSTYLKKIARPAKRSPETPRDPMGIPLKPNDEPEIRGEFFRVVAPFGLAQFHNRQPAKAYSLIAIESTLLIANLTSLGVFESIKRDGFTEEEVDGANLAKRVNNVSGVLFWATVLYGAGDGLFHNLRGARPRPVITPSVGPGSAGMSLTLRF